MVGIYALSIVCVCCGCASICAGIYISISFSLLNGVTIIAMSGGSVIRLVVVGACGRGECSYDAVKGGSRFARFTKVWKRGKGDREAKVLAGGM